VLGATGGLLFAGSGPALADHTHSRLVGNGKCAVIAESGGEKYVELPTSVFERNPNVDVAPATARNHPLHVLVHQGVPGEGGRLFVYGVSDTDACSAGYVNR